MDPIYSEDISYEEKMMFLDDLMDDMPRYFLIMIAKNEFLSSAEKIRLIKQASRATGLFNSILIQLQE